LDDGRADSLGVARKTGPATAAMPLERGEAEMEEDNVIPIGGRLRDGREIKTEKDHQQWLYEYFDKISHDFGSDHPPSEIFPAIVRVMVEWVDAIRDMDREIDLETAETLASAVRDLTDCLKRCVQSAKGTEGHG
jgi:hypothetical protein